MSLSTSLNAYLEERILRIESRQDLNRIRNFDLRVFSAIYDNMPLYDYMRSMDDMGHEAIDLKAHVYVLWVYTLGNSGRDPATFWSSLEWYEWWCQSKYEDDDGKWSKLQLLHTRINYWITQIQPRFTLQLSQPVFFRPPIPEIFYTFKWVFHNFDITC